jgi:type I restriction enzyme M protein
MLDSDTKRRIDSCRDILVGKVPDPKSQVEQITIALIYKFMDDMDADTEAVGGSRSFFAGDFAKYGWEQLMQPGVGGHEMLALYSEAIQTMPRNAGIPELFRDIFKNAYLPYRDPETLRAFLKEINGFTYDHSEKLGDAFEYLLSVLGSQGDAGQFRTPRHIIDFMVEIINPQKNETILDPACGTAGFLISAWKHILKENTDKKPGGKLTPDQRKTLIQNIKGYDISPDMVRLSLVNLYLHGFTDPHIFEYDTLTSEDRWNETADVILANPPFMSPKGGIKPHKRFSIQAKRSEVLFVDYMAEHLSPKGRAAIIVPEGIIFQSQTAYKALRKMLVENSLVAVISLPAGCFNPYSGVKTSILILDKSIAKQTDSVAFFKVENDGFGLGAQRRKIDKNDLPQVQAELAECLQVLRNAKPTTDLQPTCGQIVSKEKIAANGDYNLSGGRYLIDDSRASNFPLAAIQDVAEVASGFGFPINEQGKTAESIPFLKVSDMNLPGNETHITSWNNTVSRDSLQKLRAKSFPKGTVIFPKIGAAIATNKKRILSCESTFDNNVMGIVPGNRIVSEFLYALLQEFNLSKWASDSQPPSMRKSVVEAHTFPLPPLEVQKEIVAEIEGYQNVIDGAQTVLDNYSPHIPIHPDWPIVELGELIKLSSGEFLSNAMKEDGPYPVYGGNGINGTHNKYLFESPTIVIGRVGAYCGAVHLTEPKSWITDNGLYVKELLKPIELKFLEQSLRSLNLNQYAKVGGQPSISQSIVLERKIALPDLVTQQAIVAEIEAEQALVNANRELIARFEKKIQATLTRVWDENE